MIYKPCFVILGLGMFLFLIGCENNFNEKSSSKLKSKLGPNDRYFSMRAYPDQDFDFRAYKKSVKGIASNVQNRSFVVGFDNEWETQGPGNIGARVNNLAVDPNDSDIIYAGFSHGGIFKTTDGGDNWEPVFDDQAFLSIGHIAIDPSDSETIFVGTGDVNIPGGFFIGNGIYKSENGGDTWENTGLENNGIVAKVEIHPNNSEIIYAATMGHPSVPGNDRGLYKSTDGGDNWKQVLFLGDSTGVIDFLINSDNPDIIIASGWERYRSDFESVVSGETGGIWKSTDAGATWKQLKDGLPTDKEIGRIGLTASGMNYNTIFSIIVSEARDLEGIYRSDDLGENWTQLINYERFEEEIQGSPLGGFGWYFGVVRVNPRNDNEIYLLGVDLWKTIDGGLTWNIATPPWWQYDVHADKHDLDFLPSGEIVLSTDGGIYKYDPVNDMWSDIEDIPATQFYRVAYNPHVPLLYYGGAQDNGTTGGLAEFINSWERLWGGDGFQPVFHPTDPNIFYYETQNGNISGTIDGGGEFFPADQGLASEKRNWDMPYMLSPHDPNVMYAGASSLFRSEAGPMPIFEPVTDSLTKLDDDSYRTISALDESPITEGRVYVGTTDGNVWRTEFNGIFSDAENISAGLPNRYVTSVKASPTHASTVFVTHSGYRYNESLSRIHRSDDGGASWTDISSDLPDIGINDVLIIPGHQDSILFAATDGGIYGTVDAAQTWHRLGSNMPVIPVNDMDWNVEMNELIAATYARSIQTYNLDELMEQTSSIQPEIQEPENRSALKIYPNPASDYINLEFLNIEKGRKAEIVVTDVTGKLLYNETIGTFGKIKQRLNISDFPKGKYFLKVKVRHQIMTAGFSKI